MPAGIGDPFAPSHHVLARCIMMETLILHAFKDRDYNMTVVTSPDATVPFLKRNKDETGGTVNLSLDTCPPSGHRHGEETEVQQALR